jgi:CUT domain
MERQDAGQLAMSLSKCRITPQSRTSVSASRSADPSPAAAAPPKPQQSRDGRERFLPNSVAFDSASKFSLRAHLFATLTFSFFQGLNQSESNGNNSSSNMNIKSSGKLSSAASLSLSNDVEEINTKELAQRISAELKRYSIPQAIFAQRVLCRSQVCRELSVGKIGRVIIAQFIVLGHTFGSSKKPKALVKAEVWP